jgi:hypothetical protein
MKQYPLSPRQLEDWRYNYNLQPDFSPAIMRIETDLTAIDIPTLKAAFLSLVQKHESLRTTFPRDGDKVVQRVEEPSEKFDLIYLDEYTPATLLPLSEMVIREMRDLENGPLIRGIVCKKEATLYRLHIIVHHIVSDQWSVNIIKNDLQQLYAMHASKQLIDNAVPSLQLGEYILSKTALYNEQHDSVIKYWQSALAAKSWHTDYDIIHHNLGTHNHPEFAWRGLTGSDLIADPTGESYTTAISEHLYEQLQSLRYNEKSSILNILLAAINILGVKLTNNSQILIQCHYAGRQEAITANIIGNLLGKLIIFTEIDTTQSISSLISQTASNYQKATSHIVFSSEELNDLELTTGNFIFFDFLPKQMHNNAVYNYKEAAFNSNVWVESPLVCLAFEYKNTVVLKWSYHFRYFNRPLITLIAALFEEILELMSGNSQGTIKDLLSDLD